MGGFWNILWSVNDSRLDKISHKLAWTSLIVILTIAQKTKLQDTRRFARSVPFLGLNRVGVWQKNKYYNFFCRISLIFALKCVLRLHECFLKKNLVHWDFGICFFLARKCLFIGAINMLISQKLFIGGISWLWMNIIIIVLPSNWDIYIWPWVTFGGQIKVK